MNKVLETIKNRRSTRKYAAQQLKEEELAAILEAGRWAPSAHNDQGWHFTVLRNKKLIDELNADAKVRLTGLPLEWAAALGRNKSFHIFYESPVVVVVSGRKDALSPLVDCCAAIQNMLLAAESLGIGSCWIGLCHWLFEDAAGRKKWSGLLKLPENHSPQYCVALGYKSGNPAKAPPRRENNVNFVD